MDHHIISRQFAKDYGEMLGKLGFDIFKSPENMIRLPRTAQDALDLMVAEGIQHVSPHPGGHLSTYYDSIAEELKRIETRRTSFLRRRRQDGGVSGGFRPTTRRRPRMMQVTGETFTEKAPMAGRKRRSPRYYIIGPSYQGRPQWFSLLTCH
jgi:hypothetical protein